MAEQYKIVRYTDQIIFSYKNRVYKNLYFIKHEFRTFSFERMVKLGSIGVVLVGKKGCVCRNRISLSKKPRDHVVAKPRGLLKPKSSFSVGKNHEVDLR